VNVHVALADPEPNGLAAMLAGLIGSNLDRNPRRAGLLRDCTVELEALDAGITATVRLRPGRVEVANGPGHLPRDLRIFAVSHDLLALAAAPLRLGLPDPLRAEGRAVLGHLVRRRVRISGLLRHPVVLSRFARLLSVA
jgi:hypothetical protein